MKFYYGFLIFILSYTISNVSSFEYSEKNATVPHSRQKRYLVFPKGASLQIILEILTQVNPKYKFFLGPTAQISWALPSEPFDVLHEKHNIQNRISYNYLDTNSSTSNSISGSSSSSNTALDFWKKNHKFFNHLAEAFKLLGMTVGLAWQLPDDPKIYEEFNKKHKVYKRNALKKVEDFMKPGGANGKQCVLRALCESGQRTPSKKNFLTEILHKVFSYNELEEENESHEDKIYRKAHQSLNQDCKAMYPDCQFSIFQHI